MSGNKKIAKKVEKIAKEVFGAKVDKEIMELLLETFKVEYDSAIRRKLKKDFAENIAMHFTKLHALQLKNRGVGA